MSTNERDAASNQLQKWWSEEQKRREKEQKLPYITDAAGIDLVYKDSSQTAGEFGPLVLSDYELTQELGHFSRERIPERVVHAKGAGAFGEFEVTDDITQYTISTVFSQIGKKTPIAVRFSQVSGNLGSADTVRDPRGFALKLYTEEGVWDLVGNNTPIFFIRDPILFPMFIHTQKRNPATNLRDWDMFWDFITLRPETLHQVMFLFSDRGIPDGHRHQHGFGSHTFSLIGKNRKLTWCKFVYKTDQGIKNLKPEEAQRIAGEDPDYAVRDLYNAIEEGKKTGKYPSWTFYIQVMTPEQAKAVPFNPFDITKVWPHAQFPLIRVGKLVLNRNPVNHFAEVEQLAFNPNNIPPGIGFSPDRLLQGRLFAYQDTHYYRLGGNFEQLPVNTPPKGVANFQRDGQSAINNQGSAPNYHPNSFGGPDINPNAKYFKPRPQYIKGNLDYFDLRDSDNYSQPKVFWNKVLDEEAKTRLVTNLKSTIHLANRKIQERAVEEFTNVDPDLGRRLRMALQDGGTVNL